MTAAHSAMRDGTERRLVVRGAPIVGSAAAAWLRGRLFSLAHTRRAVEQPVSCIVGNGYKEMTKESLSDVGGGG